MEQYEELTLDFGPTVEFDDLVDSFLKQTNPWWMSQMHIRASDVAIDLKHIFSDIDSFEELNDQVFWRQVNQLRRLYSKDKDKRITALRSVVYFYIYLIKNYPQYRIFSNSRTLYPSLLENRAFVTEWLEEECRFMTFVPGLKYDNYDKYIFIFRGAENISSKVRKTDYKKIDLSSIDSPFYKKCVFEYVCSSIDRVVGYSPTIFNYPLNLLSDLKRSEGHINKSENFLQSSEIAHIVEGFNIKFDTPAIQGKVGILKSFFRWCENHDYIQLERISYDTLTVHSERAYRAKTTRPEASQIETLLIESKKKAEEAPTKYLVFDTILNLLLTTKLRISSICGLRRDCILPQLKPNTYRIRYTDKTSHGDINTTTSITPMDKQRIEKVMNQNENLISSTAEEKRDYIFLYVPNRKKYVSIVDKFSFRLYLEDLCKQSGLPHITAAQLRREYQSNVNEYAIKKKLDDVQIKTLTGHSHIGTTQEYYVKTRLEKYFEQLYLTTLPNKNSDIPKKVMDSVPKDLERVGDTHHRCGACNAVDCMMKTALPCFLCKDFITSTEFLPVFKQMADEITKRIASSSNPHDKEDLTAIKEVLVQYIVELTFKKENNG